MTFISIPRYYQLPLMYGSYEAVFLQQQSEEVEKDTLQNGNSLGKLITLEKYDFILILKLFNNCSRSQQSISTVFIHVL